MTAEKKRKYIKDEPISMVRKKAKDLESSRDEWKEKNRAKQNSIKALKMRMRETQESREDWKLKNLKNANDLEVCREKIQNLEQELIIERFEKIALLSKIDGYKKKLRQN
jgi:hypothetical protein